MSLSLSKTPHLATVSAMMFGLFGWVWGRETQLAIGTDVNVVFVFPSDLRFRRANLLQLNLNRIVDQLKNKFMHINVT